MSTAIRLSNATFLVALFSYFGAMVLCFVDIASSSDRWRRGAIAVAALGFGAQLLSLGAIAVHLHRAPYGSIYEFCSSMAVLIAGVALFALLPRPKLAAVAGFLFGCAILIMGAGWVWYAPPATLQPALRSNWLTFHVLLAITGSSLLLASSVVSVLYLMRRRWENRHPGWTVTAGKSAQPETGVETRPASAAAPVLAGRATGPGAALARAPRRGMAARLPSAERLDELARKLVIVAFPIWTLAVITGAIWGEQAWGRYWNWDPKETMSFMIWVAFAIYLHARATRGWKDVGAAWIGIAGGALILANMFVVNFLVKGLHSYAGG